jgi:thioesterase domain-containing protein
MATHYLSEVRQVQPEGPYAFTGYCFGAIVAYEMAQRMVAEGQEVRLLATFNGPSPAWIQRWGWYGNQPTLKPARIAQAARVERVGFGAKLRRALHEPGRFASASRWHARRALGRFDHQRARIALALGRQVPESLRERYFLRIHATAERNYEPQPYPGDFVAFYGEGLYEDPALGWADLVEGDVESHGAPGEHTNNRQLLIEPHVAFVRDRLVAYLERRAGSTSVAGR